MVEGVDYVELPEANVCCGSAGSQLITHYETSTLLLDRKMKNLKSTNAEIIASGCPGCQMQLMTGVQREGLKVKVMHPIQILDQAYKAQDEEK
jgi:glycolate oxidase iron-sulfur subunit